jgi:hypothetical protein
MLNNERRLVNRRTERPNLVHLILLSLDRIIGTVGVHNHNESFIVLLRVLCTVNNIGSGRERIVRDHRITVCSKVGQGGAGSSEVRLAAQRI